MKPLGCWMWLWLSRILITCIVWLECYLLLCNLSDCKSDDITLLHVSISHYTSVAIPFLPGLSFKESRNCVWSCSVCVWLSLHKSLTVQLVLGMKSVCLVWCKNFKHLPTSLSRSIFLCIWRRMAKVMCRLIRLYRIVCRVAMGYYGAGHIHSSRSGLDQRQSMCGPQTSSSQTDIYPNWYSYEHSEEDESDDAGDDIRSYFVRTTVQFSIGVDIKTIDAVTFPAANTFGELWTVPTSITCVVMRSSDT